MGEPKPAAWYDEAYRTDANLRADLESSTFGPLWREIERRVPPRAFVFEIGCGAGQLAEFLIPKAAHYAGYDWSEVAVAEARRRVPEIHGEVRVLSVEEQIGTAVEMSARCPLFRVTVVACEVFEHLAGDLDLRAIEAHAGAVFLVSLPSRDSESHVRWFESEDAVRDRYGRFFAWMTVDRFGQWWIVEGRAL